MKASVVVHATKIIEVRTRVLVHDYVGIRETDAVMTRINVQSGSGQERKRRRRDEEAKAILFARQVQRAMQLLSLLTCGWRTLRGSYQPTIYHFDRAFRVGLVISEEKVWL